MGTLAEDLGRAALELKETHISWVFLHEHVVYKVKKPVDFGFLDFSTLERRREACHAEVSLNRRLAADVYLRVVPVVLTNGVHRCALEHPVAVDSEEVVDFAVCMRRLPDAECATSRLAAGELSRDHLISVARRLAAFHAASPRSPELDRLGEPSAIQRNVAENFEQAHPLLRELVSDEQQREVETFQRDALATRHDVFRQRIAAGHVVDGHGDLRLEHVYWDDDLTPTIIDCIEFNERFRVGDACSDVAFLSMDLSWHGRPDLAEQLLADYALESNDYDLYAIVDFYQSYRAYVRAKVAALSLQTARDTQVKARLASDARQYFLLAQAALRPQMEPARVIAIGGVIASGKSTMAEHLAERMPAVRVSSDRTRKFVMGVDATAPLEPCAYTEARSRQIYDEVLRRASVVLESGRSVVLDASFRSQEVRLAARALALRYDAPFHFVECRASDAVTRRRLASRAEGRCESDARLETLGAFVDAYEAVSELDPLEHTVLNTSGADAEAAGVLFCALGV